MRKRKNIAKRQAINNRRRIDFVLVFIAKSSKCVRLHAVAFCFANLFSKVLTTFFDIDKYPRNFTKEHIQTVMWQPKFEGRMGEMQSARNSSTQYHIIQNGGWFDVVNKNIGSG